MKMETVIRSPQDGVVAKMAHKEGVSFSCLVLVKLADICRIFARRGPYWCCSKRYA